MRLTTTSAIAAGLSALGVPASAHDGDHKYGCMIRYSYRRRKIEIDKCARPDADGFLRQAVSIDGRALLVHQMPDGRFHSLVNAFQHFHSLRRLAEAAVDTLRGDQLRRQPRTTERLGRLPNNLPDLDNPGPIRVRKNVTAMTQAERDMFVNAVVALKNDTSFYDAFLGVHVDVFTHLAWGGHGDALFPWHRLYIYHFESALRALPGFSDVTIPYWDWFQPTGHGLLPFTEDFLGTNDGWRVQTGRFAFANGQWTLPELISGSPALNRGYPNQDNPPSPSVEDNLAELVNAPSYQNFSSLNSHHDDIHNLMDGHMAGQASPSDPVFWMHHCMLDKIWATWQDNAALPHYVSTSELHNVQPGESLQPWLGDLGRAVTTLDILDYQRLYTYA